MAGDVKGTAHPEEGGKVASLADARRRAAAKVKAEKRQARGTASARDWAIGGAFVLMSLGMLWHWLAPLFGATGLTR